MGADSEQQNQGNLLAAKQSPAFPIAGGLLSHALTMRGERIMLDYTQNAVGVRFEVDGVWMNVDPYDRQTGDAMLAVFKKIANLNVQDRRTRQEGKFGAAVHAGQFICTLTSQGVKTGERVLIKTCPQEAQVRNPGRLGHAAQNAGAVQGTGRCIAGIRHHGHPGRRRTLHALADRPHHLRSLRA